MSFMFNLRYLVTLSHCLKAIAIRWYSWLTNLRNLSIIFAASLYRHEIKTACITLKLFWSLNLVIVLKLNTPNTIFWYTFDLWPAFINAEQVCILWRTLTFDYASISQMLSKNIWTIPSLIASNHTAIHTLGNILVTHNCATRFRSITFTCELAFSITMPSCYL